MKKLFAALLIATPLLGSAAPNLLLNGSFESGLSSWTTTASVGTLFPVTTINYGLPASAFGDSVPADNAASLSPDAVGNNAVYFVDDNATLTLSQNFNVPAAGLYALGFSAYLPANGMINPGDATVVGKVNNAQVFSVMLSAYPATTWAPVMDTVFLNAGLNTVGLSFTTLGGMSKDLVIDRAFVTAVPEAGSWALFASGLAAVCWVVRRRSRA